MVTGLDVVGQRLGEVLRVVTFQQVDDVVGDQRREPADLLARRPQVVGDEGRGGRLDLDVVERPAGFLRPLPHELQAPLDNGGVGELNDDPVGHPPGGAERLRPVARHPDGQLVLGPLQPDLDAVVGDLTPCGQVSDQTAVRLHLLDRDWLLAEHAPGAVPAADAHHHPAAGDLVQRGERAGGHGGIARARVGDAGTDLDGPRVGGHQGEDRVDLLPEDVRVEEPRVLETLGLGKPSQIHPTAGRRIGSKADAEAQSRH